jgi:hypothetical protein
MSCSLCGWRHLCWPVMALILLLKLSSRFLSRFFASVALHTAQPPRMADKSVSEATATAILPTVTCWLGWLAETCLSCLLFAQAGRV